MSHLFNKNQYFDFRARVYGSIKKTLETKIEQLSDNIETLHPIDKHEQTILDGVQFNFLYEGQITPFSVKLLELDSFKSILNRNVIQQYLNQEDLQELLNLVPQKDINNVYHALEGKGLWDSYLLSFERRTKSGYYSSFREKEDQIQEKLNKFRMQQIYQSLLQKTQSTHGKKGKCQKPRQQILLDRQQLQQSEFESIQELEQVCQLSDDSNETQTQEQVNNYIDQEYQNQLYLRYDYSKIKTQEELLAMGQQKGDKKTVVYKNVLTVRPRNAGWVDIYRKQQLLRYSNPTKPWIYTCQDGRKVTVAPVAKKLSVLAGKPRDHPMLKCQRPACVTILTLVRDAAARLPNGVGTRADICELLKQSQYVNQDLPQQKVSNIVSGALDRLHYMADACVKYDSEKKLWIYLHMDRNNEHPGWGQDIEQYVDKSNNKKKLKKL